MSDVSRCLKSCSKVGFSFGFFLGRLWSNRVLIICFELPNRADEPCISSLSCQPKADEVEVRKRQVVVRARFRWSQQASQSGFVQVMRCIFEDAVASWRCLRVKVVVPLATSKTMVVITINPSHGIAGHARAAARSHFPPHHSPAHRNKRQAKQGRVITASVTMIMLYARQRPHLAYNVASTTSMIYFIHTPFIPKYL